MKHIKLFFVSLLLITCSIFAQPKLTMILIIDQFAHHEYQKIKPHVRSGIKYLIDNGICYENAYFPHCVPETSIGHAALNTGALATRHGIIGNQWRDETGKAVRADDDTAERAAVFSPDGVYNFGKSAFHVMVDGISDQFALANSKNAPHHTVAVSLKSHATINCAGKLGKPIWFDDKSGNFTSSKAYFDELPAWLKNFNQKYSPNKTPHLTWKLAKRKKDRAYRFEYCSDYNGCSDKPLINRTFNTTENNFKTFRMTPFANKLVLDLAYATIEEYLLKNKHNNLLLWVSLSALDYLGHNYGPDTQEITDLLLHLDSQLDQFFKRVFKKINKNDVLIVLTADHGIAPLPELMQKRGYIHAHRIVPNVIMQAMNQHVEQLFGIPALIQNFEPTQFYFDQMVWAGVQPEMRYQIMESLKTFLKQQPGIKNAWSYQELDAATFTPDQLEYFVQQQRYPGRSGQLIYLCEPYSFISEYPKGTSHDRPYGYNTHVPLIVHQPMHYEKKVVHKKVWTPQLPSTLAQILNVASPSASTYDVLPGIFH